MPKDINEHRNPVLFALAALGSLVSSFSLTPSRHASTYQLLRTKELEPTMSALLREIAL
jgi:hypothetical protein